MELLLPVSKGIASYVPGLCALRSRRRHVQAANAKYCYEVWIKHLTMLNEHDSVLLPKTFAELGPGGSLGVGLAALLSGADTYYALDIIKYSEVDLSLALLRGLVDLFRNRTPVYTGWPIDSEIFPGHIGTDDLLEATLAEPRIEEIHRALTAPDGPHGSITIKYIVPWNDPSVIRRGEVDLIVSQAVLDAARRRPRGLQPPRPDAARADDRRARIPALDAPPRRPARTRQAPLLPAHFRRRALRAPARALIADPPAACTARADLVPQARCRRGADPVKPYMKTLFLRSHRREAVSVLRSRLRPDRFAN